MFGSDVTAHSMNRMKDKVAYTCELCWARAATSWGESGEDAKGETSMILPGAACTSAIG